MSLNIIIGYLSVLIFSFFGALGATYMKFYSKSGKIIDIGFAIIFYGLNVLLMLITLNAFELTLIFNLSAIIYIYSLLLGKLFFKEPITRNKIIGIFLIVLGSIIISI